MSSDQPIEDTLASLGRIAIVGIGAAGTALARALAAHGARIVALGTRNLASNGPAHALATILPGAVGVLPPEEAAANGDLVLLTVPDDAIAPVARQIPWHAAQVVAHLSGSQGAEILAPVAERGAVPAALHPLMTFPRANPDEPVSALFTRLAGATWAIEADDASARAHLERIVTALGGHAITLPPGARVPYHLAAVFAANYVVALLAASATLWETFGGTSDDAVRALLPLVRAAVDRLASDGLPDALSGPLARGDVGTLAAHLTWLDARAATNPDLARIRAAYLTLAHLAIPVAEAKGTLPSEVAAHMRALLDLSATEQS